MNLGSEFEHSQQQEQMELNRGIKRTGGSMFYEEENASDEDRGNSKRLKPASNLTNSKSTPVILTADGKVPPYDAFKEEGRPRSAVYCPSFKEVEKLVPLVVDGFTDVYQHWKTQGYQDPEMDNICERLMRQCRNPQVTYPGSQPVALMGTAGVGKSSGINCILSQEAVAVESDSGIRGTNNVFEYVAAQEDQSELYRVVVKYLRKRQIEIRVKQHCISILALINLSTEDEEEMEQDEYTELQQKHDTALDFFITLLCGREDFSTLEYAKAYFQQSREDNPEAIQTEIMGFILEYMETQGLAENDGMDVYAAQSEAELNDIFQRISTPSKTAAEGGRQPSFWPLVSRIAIHQDRDLLNAGVVLADTPGINDTNQTVVEATKNYLKSAGTILVYAQPSRIVSNSDLDSSLRLCISLGKKHCVYLVVTMIDQKSSFNNTDKRTLSAEDRNLLQAAEDDIEKIKADKRAKQREKDIAQDYTTLRELDAILHSLGLQEAAAEQTVKQITVEIRNRMIARDVKDKLRNLNGSNRDPDLRCIFVSHTEYQKHLKGYEPQHPPTLDVKGTGIPDLRRILYRVPAAGKFEALRRLCQSRLPNIFNGIMGVLTKTRLERKQEVEDMILKALAEDVSPVIDAVSELKTGFKEHITTTIKDNEPQWKIRAQKLLAEWQEWPAGTFGAFTRKSGSWKPPKESKRINWNDLIVGISAKKLEAAFNALDEKIDIIESNALTNFTKLHEKLNTDLEASAAFQGVDQKPFFDFISNIRDRIAADLTRQFGSLKEDIEQTRYSCALANEKDESLESFVALEMQATYEECQKTSNTNYVTNLTYKTKKGKIRKRSGPHCARVETIRRRLTGEGDVISIFAAVAKRAEGDFDKAVDGWGDKAQKSVTEGSKEIVADFTRRFIVDTVMNEKNQEAAEKLQEAASKALEVIQGPMREHIELCQAYEEEAGR